MLQHFALRPGRAGLLAPLLAGESAPRLAALLDALPRRHANMLSEGRGWQKRAAEGAEAACRTLQARPLGCLALAFRLFGF